MLAKGWQVNFTGVYAKASNKLLESNFFFNYAAINAALASSNPATALNILGDWLAYELGCPGGVARAESHQR